MGRDLRHRRKACPLVVPPFRVFEGGMASFAPLSRGCPDPGKGPTTQRSGARPTCFSRRGAGVREAGLGRSRRFAPRPGLRGAPGKAGR